MFTAVCPLLTAVLATIARTKILVVCLYNFSSSVLVLAPIPTEMFRPVCLVKN